MMRTAAPDMIRGLNPATRGPGSSLGRRGDWGAKRGFHTPKPAWQRAKLASPVEYFAKMKRKF